MKNFKSTASFEKELISEIKSNFVNLTHKLSNESKHLKALAHIDNAANILEEAGLYGEAEVLTEYIEIFASPILDFVSNKPEYSEPIKSIEDGISAQEAAKLLRKHHRIAKFLETSPTEDENKYAQYTTALREYLGSVLYLKTVLDGSPRPDVFSLFGNGSMPDWVTTIANLDKPKLKYVLEKHLNSIGSSLEGVEHTLLKSFPDFKLSLEEKNKIDNNNPLAVLNRLAKNNPDAKIPVNVLRDILNLSLPVFSKLILDLAAEGKLILHKAKAEDLNKELITSFDRADHYAYISPQK